MRILHLGVFLGVTRKTEGVAAGQEKLRMLRCMGIVTAGAFSFHVGRMHNRHATCQIVVLVAAEAELSTLLIQGKGL